MKTTPMEQAEKIIRANQGVIRAAEAQKQGIPFTILQRMEQAEVLVKEARGLYRLTDLLPLVNPDLTIVVSQTPQAVICLISALYVHELTTQIPYQVDLALPRGHKKPRIDYPPTGYTWLREPAYSAGIEVHMIDGVPVNIYSAEKTVADCFKFRNKVGENIAVEALKDYLRRPQFEMDKLVDMARINRVYKIMLPYIQSLSAYAYEIR